MVAAVATAPGCDESARETQAGAMEGRGGGGGGVETKTNEERERPTNGQAEREWTKRKGKRVLGV